MTVSYEILNLNKYNYYAKDIGKFVNIRTGRDLTIKEFAEMIKQIVEFRGNIEWDTSKPDGQPRRLLDTSKALKEFGFKANTSFREGLKAKINWYEKNLKIS